LTEALAARKQLRDHRARRNGVSMSDADVINLTMDRHPIKCPHCQNPTIHSWPGNTILFSTATCTQCGKKFLIALNEPRTGA
jgi:transposase-like protein